jgi:gamma-glutamyltranspeptidase/glutathione hydrolase
MGKILAFAGLCFVCGATAHAQVGRNYGRSMVISQQGIVATSQVLASQAGAQMLARGGSAADAAIASNALLGLTEPMMTGIGGDLFVIYWDARTGKLTGLNASGPAPKALNPEFLAQQGIKTMPGQGIHSVTVPGAVEGWFVCTSATANSPGRICFSRRLLTRNRAFRSPKA